MKLKQFYLKHRITALVIAIALIVITLFTGIVSMAGPTPVKIAQTSSYDKDTDKGHTVTSLDVTNAAVSGCFTKAYELKVEDADKYYAASLANQEVRLNSFYDGTTSSTRDISGILDDGYLRFYIKAPKSMKVRIYLIDNEWSRSNAKPEISLAQTIVNGGYYEYHIPIGSIKGTNIDWNVKKLARVAIVPANGANADSFLSEDEVLCISPIELWDSEPAYNLVQQPIAEKLAVTSYVEEQGKYIAEKSSVAVNEDDPIYSSYQKTYKFAITDGFYEQEFSRNQTSMYFSAFKGQIDGISDGAQDISAYSSTACLKVYIKVPHDMKLTFYLLNSAWSYQNKVVLDVPATADGAKYTEVIVPLQGFNTAQTLARIGIGAVETEFNGTSFITTEQALYISHVELWSNTPPVSSPKKVAVTSYVEEQGKYIAEKSSVAVSEDDPIYSSYQKTYKFAITDGFYEQEFSRNQTSMYFSAFKSQIDGISDGAQDISAYSSTACLKVYIKVPHDMKLTFYLLNSAWSYQNKVVLDVPATADGAKYTEVIVPLQGFNTAQTLARIGIGAVETEFNGTSFITTEQALYISHIELWTAPQPKDDEPDEEITAEKLAETSYRENQSAYIDMSTVSIGKKSLMYSAFTTATSMKIKDGFYSQDFTSNGRNKSTIYLKSFKGVKEGVADGAQSFAKISDSAILRFFVNVPRNMKLNVYIMNGWNEQTVKTISVEKPLTEGVYAEIQIPLKDVLESSRTVTQIGIGASLDGISADTFLAEGESIEISPIELWSAKPDEYVPSVAVDEYWEALPTLSEEDKSYQFNNTNTSFWTNDWNMTTRDRSISISSQSVDKKDPLYKYFTLSYAIKVTNADVYYTMTVGNRDITFGLEKKDDARNFEKYLKTGYLRFYLNVPKDMRVRIGITDENWHRSYVVVDMKKTTDNDGWQEMQIPYKSFYDNQGGNVDFSNIVRIYVDPVDIAENAAFSENYFLKENDEVLQISRFEFWTKTPDVPKDVDIRSYYYSENDNGVILRDSDDIVATSTTFLAYENTEDIDNLTELLKTAYHNFKVKKVWSAYVLNNESYNTYRLDPYDAVEIMLPAGSAQILPDTKVVRIDEKTGEVEPVTVTTETGYLIIKTVGMGDFVFFEGEEGAIRTSGGDEGQYVTTSADSAEDSENSSETVTRKIRVKKAKSKGSDAGLYWLIWVIVPVSAVLIAAGITIFIILKKRKGKVQ